MHAPRFLRTVAATSCLGVCLVAQRVPEIEPNDTPAVAQAVLVGWQVDCNLMPGDIDWFSFTPTLTGSVKLFTSPLTPTSVDTVLSLFDASGAVLLAENDDLRGLHSDITIDLVMGVTYLVRVRGFTATTNGTYSLDLAETAATLATGSEAAEPNNSILTATTVGCGSEIEANLTLGDSDWYRVVLTAPRSGVVFSVLGGAAPQLGTFTFQIMDSTGAALGSPATLDVNFGAGVVNKQSASVRRCWPMGTYYFAVTQSGTLTTTMGNYRLECAVMDMNTNNTPAPEQAGNVSPISPGQIGTGSLTLSDDDVWGPISVSAGYLIVQTRPDVTGPVNDTRLQLLDSEQNPVKDSFGQNLPIVELGNILDDPLNQHARGTWRLGSGSGYVYVRVMAPASNPGGSYRLEIGQCGFNWQTLADSSGKTEILTNVTCLGFNNQRPTLGTDSIYEVPVLGSTFSRSVTLAPPLSPVFLMQGFNNVMMTGGPPLPVSLLPFGAPGCTLDVDPLILTFLLTDPVGRIVLVQSTPAALALSGLRIYEQVAVVDPGANPLGLTFSNVLVQTLGSLSY